MANEYMTVQEVADVLRCTRRHVNNLIETGRLPAVNIAVGNERRRYRIDKQVFEDYRKGVLDGVSVGN